MARLGVELGVRAMRAVRLDGWPRSGTRVVEIECDLDHLDDAVAALQEHVGSGIGRVALAVDLPLLSTKRVTLPALSADERRNILALEPDRFFAVRSDTVVPAVRADDGLVFAAAESPLAKWVAAMGRLGPVDLVEPAPAALARALGRVSIEDAVVVCDGRDAGVGLVEIEAGRVTRARRLFGDLDRVAAALADVARGAAIYVDPWSDDRVQAFARVLPSASFLPLPAIADVAGQFLTAYGTAVGLDHVPPFAETLVSPRHGRAIRARHRRDLGIAVAACALATVFALSSLDASRVRATRALDADIATLKVKAAPALALQTELATLSRRAGAVGDIEAERADPLRVLLALSRQMPAGAFIRGIRGSGGDWQVDGYAPNAATVLTSLGATHDFKDVHFLSAMNRAQVANQTYESFALAFRYVPSP
jgi:hypothetical protein